MFAHLAGGEGLQAGDWNLVIWEDFVVVIGVGEGQRQQALLLQISLCMKKKNNKTLLICN